MDEVINGNYIPIGVSRMQQVAYMFPKITLKRPWQLKHPLMKQLVEKRAQLPKPLNYVSRPKLRQSNTHDVPNSTQIIHEQDTYHQKLNN